MAEVIWTNTALDGLDDIAEYIAVSNPNTAAKLVQQVFETTDCLALFPDSRCVVEEVREMGYREVIVNPCRILYKLEGETVYILHVVRQARDLRRFIIHETAAEY